MRPVRILEKSCPGWEKWRCVGQWISGYHPRPCFRIKALSLSAAGAHSCIPLQESSQTGLCRLPGGSPHQWLMVPAPPSCFSLGTLKGCPSSQGFPGFGQGTRRTWALLSFSLCPILFPSLPCRYFKVLPSYTLPNKSSSESASSTKVNLS